VAEAQAREWHAHVSAEPGFRKAADVLARDTLQGLRNTEPRAKGAPALGAIQEVPAPDLPVDEPEVELPIAEPLAPEPPIPEPPIPEPARPVPAGPRSTMQRAPDAKLAVPSVRLPKNLASPSHRWRNGAIAVIVLLSMGLLVFFVGSSGADESDAKHKDATQLPPALPGTTPTVTAIATATVVPPVLTATATTSATDATASSGRASTARASSKSSKVVATASATSRSTEPPATKTSAHTSGLAIPTGWTPKID